MIILLIHFAFIFFGYIRNNIGKRNHHEGIDPVSRVLDILTGGDTNIILTEI